VNPAFLPTRLMFTYVRSRRTGDTLMINGQCVDVAPLSPSVSSATRTISGRLVDGRQVFSNLRGGLNAVAVVPTTRLSLRRTRWSL